MTNIDLTKKKKITISDAKKIQEFIGSTNRFFIYIDSEELTVCTSDSVKDIFIEKVFVDCEFSDNTEIKFFTDSFSNSMLKLTYAQYLLIADMLIKLTPIVYKAKIARFQNDQIIEQKYIEDKNVSSIISSLNTISAIYQIKNRITNCLRMYKIWIKSEPEQWYTFEDLIQNNIIEGKLS